MKSLHTEIVIDASPATVWTVLTALDRYPDWNPFIQQARGSATEGSRLEVRIAPPNGKAMTFTPTVTQADTNRVFSWLGRFLIPGLFDGEHVFELHPINDQQTRFVQRETFSGLLVPLLWKSLDTNTRQGFEAMNQALKTRAEAHA